MQCVLSPLATTTIRQADAAHTVSHINPTWSPPAILRLSLRVLSLFAVLFGNSNQVLLPVTSWGFQPLLPRSSSRFCLFCCFV